MISVLIIVRSGLCFRHTSRTRPAALLGGGTPIDMGKNFTDNKRILGDGKTIRGFVLGSLCGAIIGLLQIWLAPSIAPYLAAYVSGTADAGLVHGAVHDAGGRAAGRHRQELLQAPPRLRAGAMMPIADQLDFVAGAWALTLSTGLVVVRRELHAGHHHYCHNNNADPSSGDEHHRLQDWQRKTCRGS